MLHRTINEIFPWSYPSPPDEYDLRKICNSHLDAARMPEDVYRWIEKEDCPFKQEACGEILLIIIAERRTDMWDDTWRYMNSYILEDISSHINHIIRHARGDQSYTEYTTTPPQFTTTTTHEHEFVELKKQLEQQDKRLDVIEEHLQLSPSKKYLWPSYTAEASEEDKKNFENTLRQLCTSGAKSVSADVKNFIISQSRRGIILRPGNLKTEHSYIKLFGYPYGEKAYYGA